MPSIGPPISTVLIPAFAAIIGPIVDPQTESFLTMKSCMGTAEGSAYEAIVLMTLAPTISVI